MGDIFKLFSNVKSEEKNEAIQVLIENSAPRRDFFLMVVLSVLMSVLGFYLNNIVVLIGSMLIAPVLYPVLTVALGITISDVSLIKRSLRTISKSILYAIGISVLFAFFLPQRADIPVITDQISVVSYALVAIVSGIAASFAMVKPHMNESLPGVAVSVSLLPPLASIGIGVAQGNLLLVQSSVIIYVVNVLGVIFASMVVFSLLNLSTKKKVAEHEMELTEKEIQEEVSED